MEVSNELRGLGGCPFIVVSLSSRHYLIFRDLCGPYHTLKLEQNQKEILCSSTFQEEEASEGGGMVVPP